MEEEKSGIKNWLRGSSEDLQVAIYEDICPRCGSEGAHGEMHHSGMVEILTCTICGYIRKTITLEDQEKSIGKKHPEPLLGKDGRPLQRVTEIKGFGGFNYDFKDPKKYGRMAPLEVPIDDGLIRWFEEILRDPKIDKGACYLTRFDEKEKKLTWLYGSPKWRESQKKKPRAYVTEEFLEEALKGLK